jgi:acyl-coenzyme A thioesterase PaaI-like protein
VSAAPTSRAERRAARRRALGNLAARVRSFVDATVSTDAEPAVVERVAGDLARLEAELRERIHAGPYSGLVGGVAFDVERPAGRMPLSPFAGEMNPLAPPLELAYEGDRLVGTVVLGKAYVGPPGTAHGGVVAGLMDQMLAAIGQRFQTAGVTARMTVEFRRPTPLGARLDLVGWLEPPVEGSGTRRACAEIRHGDAVTATAEAVIVVVPGFSTQPGPA